MVTKIDRMELTYNDYFSLIFSEMLPERSVLVVMRVFWACICLGLQGIRREGKLAVCLGLQGMHLSGIARHQARRQASGLMSPAFREQFAPAAAQLIPSVPAVFF
jgi:hypothetical protein